MPIEIVIATIVNTMLVIMTISAAVIVLSSHGKDDDARRDHRDAVSFQARIIRDIAIAMFRAHILLLQKDVVGLRRIMDEVQTMRMEPVTPRLQVVRPLSPAHRAPKPPPAARSDEWSEHR